MGYSFPFGVPLVIYPVLLFLFWRSHGAWWGWISCAVFLAGVGYFLYLAASEKEYRRIRDQHPELNRLTWVMNHLLFFVLGPLALWALALAVVVRGPR